MEVVEDGIQCFGGDVRHDGARGRVELGLRERARRRTRVEWRWAELP